MGGGGGGGRGEGKGVVSFVRLLGIVFLKVMRKVAR